MTAKNVSGLKADLDTVEGQFTIPKELSKLDTVARLDILSDWTADILNALDKAHVECFIDLFKPNYQPGITFEKAYQVHMGILDKLDIDAPDESVKDLCHVAFNALVKELNNTKH